MAFVYIKAAYKRAGEVHFKASIALNRKERGLNQMSEILHGEDGEALEQVAQKQDAPLLKVFKARLDKAVGSLV